MSRAVSVKSRLHRSLLGVPGFSTEPEAVRARATEFSFAPQEELLGVYTNPEPADVPQQQLAITSRGLHWIRDGRVIQVCYRDIAAVNGPHSKSDSTGLTLTLTDGRTEALPIEGQHDAFRDVFPFLRFLDRVLADRA